MTRKPEATHPNAASFPAIGGLGLRALATAGIRSLRELRTWRERDDDWGCFLSTIAPWFIVPDLTRVPRVMSTSETATQSAVARRSTETEVNGLVERNAPDRRGHRAQ